MAEFCLDCYNRMNDTNYSPSQVTLDDEPDLCEGCGEMKPCVIDTHGGGGKFKLSDLFADYLHDLLYWIGQIGL